MSSCAVQEISSVVVEKEDGKSVVLRRSVEHPGTPPAIKEGKHTSLQKKSIASAGSLRFFCDVAQFSSKLKQA